MSIFENIPTVQIFYRVGDDPVIGSAVGAGKNVTEFSLLNTVRGLYPGQIVKRVPYELASIETQPGYRRP